MTNYHLFLDETGDHGLSFIDPNFPIFVLCGVIFENDDYNIFRKNLNYLKVKFWGNENIFLHSRDIRKCDKAFQILFDLKIKEAFYNELNHIIELSRFKIIAVGINKEEFIKKYGKTSNDPYEFSLSSIIDQSLFYLDENSCKRLKITIEKRGKKEDEALYSHYSKIYANGTYNISKEKIKQYQIDFEFKNKLDNINGLQLADLVAYPIARYLINKSGVNLAFDKIKNKIVSNGLDEILELP
jgi:hypothetical protein